MYINGIHNTVADAISCLDFGPIYDNRENWMTFTKCWCFYTIHTVENTSPPNHKDMDVVFANLSGATAIYPLTV